ncbi:MAG: conserved rane protein of unknown function [Blastococcus sp.]|nr:conserved rane protein of unknown function [Blastococcus sp.]
MLISVGVPPLGAVFFALFAYCIVRPRLFPLVLSASLAFPQSAMLVVGGAEGITPFHVGAVLCLGRLVLSPFFSRRLVPLPSKVAVGFLILVLYAGLITALGPFLFAGVEVFSPSLGIDAQVHHGTPLRYSLGNVAQYAYLVLGVAVAVTLATVFPRERGVLLPGLALGVGLSTLRLLMEFVGLSWPTHLFDTMPGYAYAIYGNRARGVFSEPSMLGTFAAVALTVFVLQLLNTDRTRSRVVLAVASLSAVACLVLAQSATGYATVLVLAALVAVSRLRRRAGGQWLPYYAVAAIGCALGLAWQGRAVVDALFGALPAKLATESFANRLASDGAGIEILVQTLGLGAGLGSNRSSSLATTLLSCLGIIGTVAFAVLVIPAIRSSLREPAARLAGWGLVALLVAQMVAQPDLSNPLLWFLLGLCLAGGAASTTHRPADGDISRARSARAQRLEPPHGLPVVVPGPDLARGSASRPGRRAPDGSGLRPSAPVTGRLGPLVPAGSRAPSRPDRRLS